MNYTELGNRIRQAREAAVLSQDVVAQSLGLSRSAISLIESGKRKIDSLELRTFANLVNRSVVFFLDDDTESTDNVADESTEDPTQMLFSANQVVDISRDRGQIDRFREFHRDFALLERLLNIPTKSYSTKPLYDVYKPTPAAAKWMATRERGRLGIPMSSPITNMRQILQDEGIRVMAWTLTTAKLGGCFIFSKSLGSFVLVKSNLKAHSANSINFVLAHEYCHHLIHRQQQALACDPNSNYRRPEEYFAQWFAANFLMPEEALVPKLQLYLGKTNGEITPQVVFNLALDFGVSYKAMLYRMTSRGVELLDKELSKQLGKAKVTDLLAESGRSITPLNISKFPDEYVDMSFFAYGQKLINTEKLSELLDLSIEDTKQQLIERSIPVDFGVDSEEDLIFDISNA
jgi:Zn-dependent peptidase ImmA (M78 family)/transcriptional regulator with XRE-family HTH domain